MKNLLPLKSDTTMNTPIINIKTQKAVIKKWTMRLSAVCLISSAMLFTSCDDYLDTLPDNRMELSSPDEVSKLLVSAYSSIHPAYLLEMYSDNTDEYDNASWVDAGRFQEQAYRWRDITETQDYETPSNIWTEEYLKIETANNAIVYIESLSEAEQKNYSAQLGEALLCRAYAMFSLSTVFCHAYDEATAATDLGLPYPEKPQEKVGEEFERGTLAELYQKIAADIERGLPLLSNNYAQPKFHFTRSAANAFAARFYLYYHQYEKAVDYATAVLGSHPASLLRDWATFAGMSLSDGMVQENEYISSSNNANLLLQVTYSEWGFVAGPYGWGARYAHGDLISKGETIMSEGVWGNSNDRTGRGFNYQVFYTGSLSKYFIPKIPMKAEYTDIQAGIGFPHRVMAVFTTDETLMVRAEAEALLGHYDAAVADINAELSVFHSQGVQVTLDDIRNYYGSLRYYTPTSPTPRKQLNTSFTLDATQEALLQCILQLRRILTIHDGLRLQDVKRYGIKIYRRRLDAGQNIKEVTDSLLPRDPRCAIQLPFDVIEAGLERNPR